MNNILLLVTFIFFNLENVSGQNDGTSEIKIDSLSEFVNKSNDTTLYKGYWEFMLNVSRNKLKKKFDYIDKNNLIVNMYKLNYSLDSIEWHLLDFISIDPIHACYEYEWHRKSNFKKQFMDKHKKFYAKFECRCKEEWAKLDSNLIRLLVLMDSTDQKYRKSGADAPWFPQNKDKWIEQGHLDNYNQMLLEHIFKNYGFPNYKSIGVGEIELVPFAVLLHCKPDFIEKYLPLLKNASNKEEIPKSFYAQAQDRLLMLKGLPQIYGTQLVWNKKAEVLELYKVKDMKTINQLREEVELGKLSSYLRANHAIIPEAKTEK